MHTHTHTHWKNLQGHNCLEGATGLVTHSGQKHFFGASPETVKTSMVDPWLFNLARCPKSGPQGPWEGSTIKDLAPSGEGSASFSCSCKTPDPRDKTTGALQGMFALRDLVQRLCKWLRIFRGTAWEAPADPLSPRKARGASTSPSPPPRPGAALLPPPSPPWTEGCTETAASATKKSWHGLFWAKVARFADLLPLANRSGSRAIELAGMTWQ